MQRSFLRQTVIPERRLVVSTTGNTDLIGIGRTAETMIFRSDAEGHIVSWEELWMESHGMYPDPSQLEVEHERIVASVRSGTLEGLRDGSAGE